MANKERNKRSARKARAQQRAEREAAQAASQPSAAPKKAEVVKAAPKKKDGKPGFFKRIGNYFSAVRSEMRRVVWPSRTELKNYSLGVIAMLFVFGIAIWLVDLGIMGVLTGFASLRG